MIDKNKIMITCAKGITPKNSLFANVKCKDAIVDRIKEKCGQRPDSGPEKDRVVVNLYWKNEDCSIYLDTSGEPLSRRNYRKIPMHAPMQETLAAAVIRATGWNGNGHFINPMCGSGNPCHRGRPCRHEQGFRDIKG